MTIGTNPRFSALRSTYAGLLGLAGSKWSPTVLGIVSFLESSIFPVPPDALLAPMVAARPGRRLFYASLCTVTSVAGGVAGYAVGYYLEPQALHLLNHLGASSTALQLQDWFVQHGLWVILLKGVTILPYKVVTISAGLAHFDLATFIAASVVARGARFFLVAELVARFGAQVLKVFERQLLACSLVLLALAAATVIALKIFL